LRNEPPYEESFQAALDTAYEGFVVDLPSSTKEFRHDAIQNALDIMDEQGLFRTDVTQPFGLGTKCAKTYVTRCLLGDQGTTYKYLGLRMFAHPWDNHKKTSSDSLEDAVDTIRQLNTTLTERTTHHLSELDKRKRRRGGERTRGRAGFDISLINRMQNTADLKQEPSMGKEKCTVSWHADSSLEHYSTIAVYHTVTRPGWFVALRVAHHSEGPEAARRGTDITPVVGTPPLAVSPPSGSAYYLLDDFNHHHQHAVLAGEGIRFSSTHRLLRESHNVNCILERCKKVCSMFHKKGKIWRSEQLLLTELESEWIRQFYIQGQQHYDLLWKVSR
jgi:alpha-ketoglutarate-dependent dioxygenase FTO